VDAPFSAHEAARTHGHGRRRRRRQLRRRVRLGLRQPGHDDDRTAGGSARLLGPEPLGQPADDETPLTGDTPAKVKAAAAARLGSDATFVRVETDADGHAAYEAHMLKADGTPATVYVDTSFDVVSVETR
jgi:hypothetical protein